MKQLHLTQWSPRDGQKKQKVHVSIQRVDKFPISFDLPSHLLTLFGPRDLRRAKSNVG